jgi:hypothetical protein
VRTCRWLIKKPPLQNAAPPCRIFDAPRSKSSAIRINSVGISGGILPNWLRFLILDTLLARPPPPQCVRQPFVGAR